MGVGIDGYREVREHQGAKKKRCSHSLSGLPYVRTDTYPGTYDTFIEFINGTYAHTDVFASMPFFCSV